MSIFNIALLQIAPTGTLEGNLAKGIEACKKAKKLGADLALFPEAWSSEYEHLFFGLMEDIKDIPKDNIAAWQDKAIVEDGEFVQSFAQLAKELGMAIAITFFEKTSAEPKNTVIVFDRFGKKALKYSKVHTVDFKWEYFMTPGDGFSVGELDYGRGKVKLGSMICYDRNFPESARINMLKGAEIIIVPNACRIYDIHMAQLKTRACENAVVVAMSNYPIEAAAVNKSGSNGRSCAFSPIFRNKDKYATDFQEIDTTIIEMGANEEITIAPIDLDALYRYRPTANDGNAFRKPKMYDELLNEEVEEPFVRKYARR